MNCQRRVTAAYPALSYLPMLFLAIACLLSVCFFGAGKAYASNEELDPSSFRVNSVQVLNNSKALSPSDELIVALDIECSDGEFNLSDLQFYAANQSEIYGEDSSTVVGLTTNAEGQLCEEPNWPLLNNGAPLHSGRHIIGLSLKSCTHAGNWQIQLIQVGIGKTIYSGGLFDKSMGPGTFKINDKANDTSAPMLQGIKVYPSYQGEKAKMKLVCIEPSGLKKIRVRVKSLDGSSYASSDLAVKEAFEPAYHNYDLELQLPYNARLGDWIVESIDLEDMLGNVSKHVLDSSSRTLRQIAPRTDRTDALCVTPFTVSQPADAEVKVPAPAVTSFEILNGSKTVQRPGILKVKMGLHEENGGFVDATVMLARTDGQSSTEATFRSLRSGTHTLDIPIPASAYLGTWNIEVELRDAFGNVATFHPSTLTGADGLLTTQLGQYESSTGSYPLLLGLPSFQVVDEFNYAFNTSLSYPRLIEQIKSMEDGKAVRVRIDGSGILPAAAFDAIRGTNKIIVCWSGAYQWVFRGAAIHGPSKDINLLLQIGEVEASRLDSTEPAVSLDFKPNGTLPGKCEVRFKSDYLYKFASIKGDLKLFYVENNHCKREDSKFDLVFDGTDKWCHVDITHNSKFLITTKHITAIKNAQTSSQSRPLSLANAAVSVKDKTYNGKSQKAGAVTVKVGGKTLRQGVDYTVASKAGKAVGSYKVTVKGKGNYAGTKTATFKIVPKGTSVKKLAKGKKSFTVTWKKPSKAALKQTTGYQVRWSLKSSMKGAKSKTVKASSAAGKKCNLKVSKLKGGKKYYVQVRAYKKVGGKTYYSAWSKAKAVKVRK